MDEQIQKILADLYAIDPSFRQHEAELEKIIQQLLQAKPDTKFDAAFAESLRRKLLAQASVSVANRQPRFAVWQKASFAVSGVIVIVLAILAGFYYRHQSQLPTSTTKGTVAMLSQQPEITRVGDQAFGSLSAQDMSAAPQGSGSGNSSSAAAPAPTTLAVPTQPEQAAPSLQAAPSPNQATAPSTASPMMPAIGRGGAGSGAIGAMPILPPLYNYKYVYKGDNFPAPTDSMDVYRKVTEPVSSDVASQILQQLNLGMMDAKSFDNLRVQSFNLVQDSDYGYNIGVNLEQGTLSISQNWPKWPNPTQNCQDQQCFDSAQLKLPDIPSNGDVIAVASQFLQDHRIATDNYGEPVVLDGWRRDYAASLNKAQYYFPEEETVMYPLKINGSEVYDEAGNPSGLAVSVNLRYKKVSGVSELSAQHYESSSYPVSTDVQALIQDAENGGYHGIINYLLPQTSGQKDIEIDLGTPTLSYMQVYKYDNGNQQTLLVPALVFPVTQVSPSQPYFKQNVMVPLVKDLLQNNPTPGGPVRILNGVVKP